MKINIILPFFLRKPGGGFKIMYEYANHLIRLGFDIKIYHCSKLPFTINESVPDWKIRSKYRINRILGNNNTRPKWIALDHNIQCEKIPFVRDKYIRDADFIITTWWATALECQNLSVSKGRRLNLIQGYECWMGHEDLLHKSYNIPNQINIAISKYVYNKVASVSNNRLELIPNSINPQEFFIKEPIRYRKSTSISFMYSKQELKGAKYALDALAILKAKYPDLEVQIFSVYSKPRNLLGWINFYKNPSDLCSIYNSTAIFLSTSLEEGWGLTPMEGLASGCACVATDIAGHKEFLVDKENALLVSPRNVAEVVDKVSILIENNDDRIRLAESGYQSIISSYTWDASVLKLEKILRE